MTSENGPTQRPWQLSYLLMAGLITAVLCCGLVPAAIAGLAVHVLTNKLARRLPTTLGRISREFAFVIIAITVITGLTAAIVGIWSFLSSHNGLTAIFVSIAETVANIKRYLPESVAANLPASVEEVREQTVAMLRANGASISSASVHGLVTFVQILIGMIIGGLTAVHEFRPKGADAGGFLVALHARARAMAVAFDKVVFAQVKISLLNSTLTGLFLIVAMPLCGMPVPMAPLLIVLTFVCGLLPVVGNLLSNSAITLVCLGVSPLAAGVALCFLIVIHKLEYFANAKIVGGEVNAATWELLCAMLLLEGAWGLPGLVAAPAIYGWLKTELDDRQSYLPT